jgi:helicase required for RNAi-mediated heterochromatin assembly 1
MSKLGPIVRVEFGTRSQHKIAWGKSKRLRPGKLVAISTRSDGFRSICKLATIVQRPYFGGLDQDPPLVDLMWAKTGDAVLDPSKEMTMVESHGGFFEATRHALVGLQLSAQTP